MGSGASILNNNNIQEMSSIISKMDISLPSQLQENKKRVVIGRVIAENEPLVSPISFKRCVMYQLMVEVFDMSGMSKILFTEKRNVNFFLTDSTSLIYIPVTVYDDIFISQTVERLPVLDSNNYHLYRDLFNKHGFTIEQYPSFRLNEEVYEIGEQLAILGRPEYAYINSQRVLELRPTNKDQYDPKWYQKHNFTDQEINNWENFLTHGKLVCSDDAIFFRGVTVPFTPPQFNPGPIIPNYNYEKMALLAPRPTPPMQQQQQQQMMMMNNNNGGAYPNQGYPPQPIMPQQQQQQFQQQPQQQMMGGYPNQQGFPNQQPMMNGFPQQQQFQQPQGYPQQQQFQQPQQQMMGGYPNQQQPQGGFQQPQGFPNQQQGFPQQFPQQQGFPQQQQGYPQQPQGGFQQPQQFPQQQQMMGGYPNQQQPQGGFQQPQQQPLMGGFLNQQQQQQQPMVNYQQQGGQHNTFDREERRRRRRERRERGEQTSDTSDSDDGSCSSGSSHGGKKKKRRGKKKHH